MAQGAPAPNPLDLEPASMVKRASAGLALALAAGTVAAGGCARSRAAEDGSRGSRPVKAHVVPVVSRSVQRTVDSVGSLFPFEEVTVGPEVEGRVAQVFVAGKKLGDTVIRAPFGGHVKDRMVTQGQYVKVQTPVMVIVATDRLRARLKVPEKMAAWVAVGQPVKVQVEAYPERAFEGAVSRMNPSVDPQTRSFDVEALLENRDGVLKPGFFARASIVSSRVDQALVVPQHALRYQYGVYKGFTVPRNGLHAP